MNHLTNPQIQAVADGEGSRADRDHAAACEPCQARVEKRIQNLAAISETIDAISMPPGAARRIDAALEGSAASSAGATRLRPHRAELRWRPAVWGTAGVAAATLVAIVVVAPMLKQDRGGVSAAGILAESANRLAREDSGVELLEYELVLDGVPREMMPDHENGAYHVRQAIDHGTRGRFRFASYGPDGQPVSSIAQDPVAGRRVMMINLGGQAYRFEVSVPPDVGLSLPELERLHMEATIAMMQASGDQLLEIVETPEGRQYRIEVPKVSAPVTSPVWDLSEARVLIDARDYRIIELAVKGTFLKQPYSVSFKLNSRSFASAVPPETFEVPRQPGEIVISGAGSVLPSRDAMVLALGELARLKQSRQ